MAGNLFTQLAIPLVALALGTLCHCCDRGKTVGKLLVYFGSQTCMNLYVKSVLNSTIIMEGLKGIPASFFVTLSQQVISGFLFMGFMFASYLFGRPYIPRPLTSKLDYIAVVCFSMAFAMNIGLNNFSLSLIPLSINLVIRACLPLSTLLSQQLLGPLFGEARKPLNLVELTFMLIGVSCAALTVLCDYKNPVISDTFLLGVLSAMGSVFSGAINMVLAGLLGTSLKMNPLDTTGYMSLPSSIFLTPIVLLMMHPIASSWDKNVFPSPATDWQVVSKVLEHAPDKLFLVALFGPIAFAYNMLQWALVQSLSATHTSFAGNANKAATICLALLLGLETLPPDHWGVLKVVAVSGNILAFTAYSVRKEVVARRQRILALQAQDEGPGPLPSQNQFAPSSYAQSYARDSRGGASQIEVSFRSSPLASRQSSPRCPSEAMGNSFLDIKERLDAS